MTAPEHEPNFTIVGAGLGGALLACYLGQAGYRVDVFERRPDPTLGKTDAGRSINLAISTRGISALRGVGLDRDILELAVPMPGRMIHHENGSLAFQPYGRDPTQAIQSVSRAGLNIALVNAARRFPGVRVHFDHKCVDADPDRPGVRLLHTATGASVEHAGGIIIGADGAFSPVRRALLRRDGFDFSQSYLQHGYKELSIPPAEGGGFRMEPHALHIWPRRSFMMIALPNADGSFTCTLFYPHEGPESFATLKIDDDVRALFKRHFPDAVPLMPTLIEDFRRNPTSFLMTVRCGPWSYDGKMTLLGDAAHAVVPFYGQGANASFEDVEVFHECVREFAPDWPTVLKTYNHRRKPNVDALADLAIHNFIEMRDHTGSKTFRLRKRAEHILGRLLPGLYKPLYGMVTFSQIPYALAVRRDRKQKRILIAAGAVVLFLLAIMLLW